MLKGRMGAIGKAKEKLEKKIFGGLKRKGRMAFVIILMILGCSFSVIGSAFAEEDTKRSEIGEVNQQDTADEKIDTDAGLRNIVIDSTNDALTDDQKAVVGFFDRDYIIYDREFFERYENYFSGCKVTAFVRIKKIVGRDENTITFLAEEIGANYAYNDTNACNMYVTCPKLDVGIMEGDEISLYGVFQGMITKEIDGTTYNLANVVANRKTYVSNGEMAYYGYDTMKMLAETMFGGDIRVDKISDAEYSVVFEKQTNINFSKVSILAYVDSAADSDLIYAEDATGYYYNIIVAPDFNHYYYFSSNSSTNVTTLSYYDKNFEKIWKREFEDTENIAYDYTDNNFYLAINNNLYIIDANTGEDRYSSVYVGPISNVYKTRDGIYLVRRCGADESTKADVVMKLDNVGQRIWSAKLETEYYAKAQFQVLGDTVLLDYYDPDYNETIAVIDAETGNIIQTCGKTNGGMNANNNYSQDSYYEDASSDEYIWTVRVDSGYLALRDSMGFDASNEIGELYTGDSVKLIDASDSTYWYVYSYSLDAYGYVNCNYIY